MIPPAQPKNPNELLLITREELERCCSQMSAAGYKVSANYVEASVLSRSRPAPPAINVELIATIDEKIRAARDRAYKQGYQAAMTAQHHQPPASRDALEELDRRCKIAAEEYAPNPDKGEWASDSHRDPFNEVREWIAELLQSQQGGDRK